MAYDPALADLLRGDLAGQGPVVEKKMFGGLAFMLRGNMVCCIMNDGGLYRVGKAQMEAALALPGVTEMDMAGRKMGGFVILSEPELSDDEQRGQVTAMALSFVHSLPPK